MSKRFDNAKVGDKVVCSSYGKGEICGIDGSIFPIRVNFTAADNTIIYTREGKYTTDAEGTLRYAESASETGFRNAKAGDKVYCLIHGSGLVVCTLADATYPIGVDFKGIERCYTFDGKSIVYAKNPTLFWAKPEIIATPRPKQKVEKKVDVWVYHDARTTAVQFSKPVSIDPKIVPGVLTYTIEE